MTMNTELPTELVPPSVALGTEFVLPADEAGPVTTTAVERLAFRVGPLGLLIPPDVGREVVLPPAVSRLPHLPAWFTGVANVRGLLLPVVDLAAAFAVERDQESRRYLLICGAGDDAIGLLVDGLPLPRNFEAAERMSGVPPHPEMLSGHVHGAYVRDGKVWLDTDAEGFIEALGEHVAA
jgi:chemotaxis signal transduction protein